MFSGIGGFELGLLMSEKNVKLVGYSEIDKYAIEVFEKRFKGINNYGNATIIDETKLPNFDLFVGGFPCQAFSVAGKQRGFDDTRGTLFFDVARILAHKKPKHFILENVRGLLSHDSGRTFQTIIRVLTDIGYLVQWEVCNSKNYGVPQNRERVYIVGHLRGNSRPEVFPIGKINEEDNRNNQPKEITKDMSMAYRVYDASGLSTTLRAVGGGVGAKTGLYQVGNLQVIAKKRTYQTPKEINDFLRDNKGKYTLRQIAELIDLPKTQVEHYFRSDHSRAIPSPEMWMKLKSLLNFNDTYDKQVTDIYEKEVEFESTRRVYSSEGISNTLNTAKTGLYQVGVLKNHNKLRETENSTCIDSNYWKGLDNHAQRTGVKVRACLTPDRLNKRQNGRRFKDNEEPMFTLTGQDKHGVMIDSSIRRLTPMECERLQGFPDGWTEGISDTQRYKCLGNAVTTNVVCEIARRLLK
jgi:DNA (cytosine-5)-methyltransferase 1